MKSTITTAVEITDTHAKVLSSRVFRGAAKTRFYDIKEIAEKNDDRIIDFLRKSIARGKIKGENIVTVVPRRFTMLRTASLPSHSDEEISKMVNLQVVRQGPYPQEDVAYDYIVLEKDPSGYSKVMVVIVHKEVVQRYLEILKRAGLNVNRLTLSSLGIVQWYSYYERKARARTKGPVVIIHVDSVSSEICFYYQGGLLFSRSIDYGARDLTSERVEFFAEQIRLTMTAYNKENIGEETEKIIVLSSLEEIALLGDSLSAEYKVPIEIIDPFGYTDIKKKGSPPDSLLKSGTTFVVAQGLVLANPKRLISLFPEEFSDTKKIQRQKREWVKFLSLLFLAVFLCAGVFYVKMYKRSNYLKQLEQAIQNLEPKVKSVEERKRRLLFLNQKLGPRVLRMDIIREVYKLTPENISFNLLHVDEQGRLTLKGLSREGAAVNDFQSRLAGSDFFKNVTLQYATKRRIFKGEVTDFKIVCDISPLSSE